MLAPAAMVVGNAPDQRRAAPDRGTVTTPPASSDDVNAQGASPSVTIAASAISINVGDKIIGTIIGPDSQGNRHFIAAQGIFSIDPQSALDGLNKATFVVTRTNRGIEAILTQDILQPQLQAVPVKLQLVQANITPLTEVLNTDTVIAADMPITLATEIGQALRSIGVVLPQGFSLTPKSLPVLQAPTNTIVPTSQDVTIDTPLAPPTTVISTLDVSAPVAPSAILSVQKPIAAALVVGSDIKIEIPATVESDTLQKSMSLLADLPDNKSNRAMILQSPLFANLLKSGRLIVVAAPINTMAQAQILSTSDVAQLAKRDQPTVPIVLRDTNDTPLPLPTGRLLLLVDTASSKALPLVTNQSIETLLPLTTEDAETLRVLQNSLNNYNAISRQSATALPALKADLPADILLLFNAFGRKLTVPVLHKIAEARYNGDTATAPQQSVVENMAQLIQRSAAPAPIAESQQRLVLPLQVDGQLIPLVFVFSPPQDRPFEDAWRHDDALWTEKEQIFALSIEFDQLGPLTLRGRCDAHSLHLAVETRAALPEALENSTKALFLEALDAAAMVGSLHFSLTFRATS
jgi:hypothetical protein